MSPSVNGADVTQYLVRHDCAHTAEHVARVAREARRLAERFGLDPDAAETAGWLHDISNVIPNRDRLQTARAWGVEILPEEETFPLILHQKLSVVIARDQFGVTAPAVLSAIGCHTTLKPGSTALDRLVFLADKIEWDQADAAPYREELLTALQNSLDHAAILYLGWMHAKRADFRVIHPWLRAAYEEMTGHTWET